MLALKQTRVYDFRLIMINPEILKPLQNHPEAIQAPLDMSVDISIEYNQPSKLEFALNTIFPQVSTLIDPQDTLLRNPEKIIQGHQGLSDQEASVLQKNLVGHISLADIATEHKVSLREVREANEEARAKIYSKLILEGHKHLTPQEKVNNWMTSLNDYSFLSETDLSFVRREMPKLLIHHQTSQEESSTIFSLRTKNYDEGTLCTLRASGLLDAFSNHKIYKTPSSDHIIRLFTPKLDIKPLEMRAVVAIDYILNNPDRLNKIYKKHD